MAAEKKEISPVEKLISFAQATEDFFSGNFVKATLLSQLQSRSERQSMYPGLTELHFQDIREADLSLRALSTRTFVGEDSVALADKLGRVIGVIASGMKKYLQLNDQTLKDVPFTEIVQAILRYEFGGIKKIDWRDARKQIKPIESLHPFLEQFDWFVEKNHDLNIAEKTEPLHLLLRSLCTDYMSIANFHDDEQV